MSARADTTSAQVNSAPLDSADASDAAVAVDVLPTDYLAFTPSSRYSNTDLRRLRRAPAAHEQFLTQKDRLFPRSPYGTGATPAPEESRNVGFSGRTLY